MRQRKEASRRRGLAAVACLCSLAASSPQAQEHRPAGMEAGVAALLDQVDWDKAEIVEVRLEEHSYSPAELVFKRNRPYILRLNNVGVVAHDMVGGSFFGAVAIKMAQNRGGRVVTPVLHSVYVKPKQQMELWFVPVRSGRYSFFCSIDGHREGGMEGEVIIQ